MDRAKFNQSVYEAYIVLLRTAGEEQADEWLKDYDGYAQKYVRKQLKLDERPASQLVDYEL